MRPRLPKGARWLAAILIAAAVAGVAEAKLKKVPVDGKPAILKPEKRAFERSGKSKRLKVIRPADHAIGKTPAQSASPMTAPTLVLPTESARAVGDMGAPLTPTVTETKRADDPSAEPALDPADMPAQETEAKARKPVVYDPSASAPEQVEVSKAKKTKETKRRPRETD